MKTGKKTGTLFFLFLCMILSVGFGITGCSRKDPEINKNSGESISKEQTANDVPSLEEKSENLQTEWSALELYREAAEAIIADAEKSEERSLSSVGNPERLAKVLARMAAGEEISTVYLGGSITEGYLVNSKQNYIAKTTAFLKGFFENDKISAVNAGLSGTPSVIGQMRLQKDVLSKKPDLIVVEFAVNDAKQILDKQMYESLLRDCLLSDTEPAVILLFTVTQNGYTCEEQMKQIGEAYRLPMISVNEAIRPELEAGTLAWGDYSVDEVHPGSEGHSMIKDYFAYLFAEVITQCLEGVKLQEPDDVSVQVYGAPYSGLKLYNTEVLHLEDTGGFVEANSDISAFPHDWIWNKKPGGALKFRMKGRDLFLLYKEANSDTMGTAEVYVDGKLAARIHADSPDGWNNPEYALVLNDLEEAEHEVEIRMADDSIGKNFHLLGLGTTGELYGTAAENGEELSLEERAVVNVGATAPLKRVMERAKSGEQLTIGFLGGSITMGTGASLPDRCYAKLVFDWWSSTFPEAEFTYINAGIGATTSQFACARAEEDLLQYEPDVVIVEFSVNDGSSSFYSETYESLIRKLLTWKTDTHSTPAVLLLNMVEYDTGNNAQSIHNEIGEYYQLPIVSMKDSIYQEIKFGRLSAADISSDNLHPNDRGHALAAELLNGFLKQINDGSLSGEEEQPLKEPLKPLHSIFSKRYDSRSFNPKLDGFIKDPVKQNGITDVFKNGYMARHAGASIRFTAEGSYISLQYRKTNALGAPEAVAVIDGNEANTVKLDGNYPNGWGDWLYLEQIYAGEPGEHTVEIRLTSEGEKNDFYLVSVITASGE